MDITYNLDQLVSIEYFKLKASEYYIADPVDSFFPFMRLPKRICSHKSYWDWWVPIDSFKRDFTEILFVDWQLFRKPKLLLTFSNSKWPNTIIYYDRDEDMMKAYNEIIGKINGLENTNK